MFLVIRLIIFKNKSKKSHRIGDADFLSAKIVKRKLGRNLSVDLSLIT
jgi:hypothetical protein